MHHSKVVKVLRRRDVVISFFNKIVCICAVIAEIAVAVLYPSDRIPSLFWVSLIIAGVTAILIVLANALKNWKSALIYAAIALFALCGVCKISVCTSYCIAYGYTQTKNAIAIRQLQNSDLYIKELSYGGCDYFADANYRYLYSVKGSGLDMLINAVPIYTEKEADTALSEYMGDFFLLNGQEEFKTYRDQISLSYAPNQTDDAVFVKIVTPDKYVFYSYLTVENVKQFPADLGISSMSYLCGNTNFILTGTTWIINGMDTSDEEYSYGDAYLITANDKYYVSIATAVKHDVSLAYPDRINYFIYKDKIQQYERYSKMLDEYEPGTDEYEIITGYVETTKKEMPKLNVELTSETTVNGDTVRTYIVCKATDNIEQMPNVSVVEIQREDLYIYGMTDIQSINFSAINQ